MQTAAFALVCLMSAGAVALAAEPARLPVVPQSAPSAPPDVQTVAPPKDAAPRDLVDAAAAHARPEAAHRLEPPHGGVCFNAAETRDKIVSHRLAEPFRALRAGRLQGEALRVRLCRWKTDQFVYEIAVLRRDGRIVHVYMNAENGQIVGALTDLDHK